MSSAISCETTVLLNNTSEKSTSRRITTWKPWLWIPHQEWSLTDSDEFENSSATMQAAFLIHDAVVGTDESLKFSRTDICDARPRLESSIRITDMDNVCRQLYSFAIFRTLRNVLLHILVLLTFLEQPIWCRYAPKSIGTPEPWDPKGYCHQTMDSRGIPAGGGDTIVDYYPNTSTILLTVIESQFIEFICLLGLWMYFVIYLRRDRWSFIRFLLSSRQPTVRMLEFVVLNVSTLALVFDAFTQMRWQRNFLPYCRIILYVISYRDCLREFQSLCNMLPEVVNSLFLLFLFMAFYSWIGVVCFYGSEEGDQLFPNIFDAMFTLWIATTTANYPDVMMPAYNQNRMAAIYFIVYMVVTFFFLMNIILASVVNAYDNELESRREIQSRLMHEKLSTAFDLMDPNETGRVHHDCIMELFSTLHHNFNDFRKISCEEASIMFNILDKDELNSLSRDQFMNIGHVLLLELIHNSDRKPYLQVQFPALFESSPFQAFRTFIDSSTFESSIDVILVINAFLVLIQSYPMLIGKSIDLSTVNDESKNVALWEGMESVFACIYVLEIASKILVNGWHNFAESNRNIFDAIITVLAVLATSYEHCANDSHDTRLIRFIVMARVLRLTRLLVALAPFQLVARIAIEVVARAKFILLMLFCVCYCFATFGVQIFGGMISRNPTDSRAYLLLDSDFARNNYWANNFNDMLGAMNVLFNLLVVNNWTECQAGFEAVTQSRYNRFFFVAFHVAGVVLVNNLVLAFIINAFIQQWDLRHEKSTQSIAPEEVIILARRTKEIQDLDSPIEYRAKIRQGGTFMNAAQQAHVYKNIFSSSSSISSSHTS
jgi:Ion transport protein